jgi:hypothetical protein
VLGGDNLETLKERCFRKIDWLIDYGFDVENLKQEMSDKEYNALRKQFVRAGFPTFKDGLIEYGLFKPNGTPTLLELHRCYYIDEHFAVKINEYEKERLLDVYYIDEDAFKKLSRDIKNELELDAIDEFYRGMFPDGIKHTTFENEKYFAIRSYVGKHFGSSVTRLLESYGTPYHIFVERDYNRKAGQFLKLGFRFESLVKEVLEVLYYNVKYQQTIGNCKPDFIVGKDWLDAKLSYKTLFHPQCETLEKYATYTERLTIIYALDKRKTYKHGYYEMVHISGYYDQLNYLGRRDLVEDIERFIWTAEEVNGN